MDITVVDAMGGRTEEAEVPTNVPAGQIIQRLVELMELPATGADGQALSYTFRHDASGGQIGGHETLDEAGVRENDVLRLCAETATGGTQRATITIIAAGNRTEEADVPRDVAAGKIIDGLVELMELPAIGADGQALSYSFHHKASGRLIGGDETLDEAGIRDNDVLALCTETATCGTQRATRMDITVVDAMGRRTEEAEVPRNVPAGKIIEQLVELMKLPATGVDGQALSYTFDHKASGRQIRADETLDEAGVRQNDVLRLCAEMTAGGGTRGKTPSVFISYRRSDARSEAGRLYDRFADHFGETNVFMDLDSLEPGADYVDVIHETVGRCDVLIAVIGPNWLHAAKAGSRRLDDPQDWVRLEILHALRRNIRVIPALVNGASMPAAADLPDELQPLTRRHATELGDRLWRLQVADLIANLEQALGARTGAPPRRLWRRGS